MISPNLLQKFPLPHRWEFQERVCDTIDICGRTFYRNGLLAASGNKMALGSVAGLQQREDLAYYELLERLYLQEFFQREEVPAEEQKYYFYAFSNGVAIHFNEDQALLGSRLELVERDRVLRSWYGQYIPKVSLYEGRTWNFLASSYDIYTVEFSNPHDCLPEVHVRGLFCFPKSSSGALLFHSFGAALDSSGALLKAEKELAQRISFLWNEKVNENMPFVPSSEYHQEFYLNDKNRPIVKNWLEGGHYRYWPSYEPFLGPLAKEMVVDKKEISFEEKTYYLVKTSGGGRIKLYFGQRYPVEREHQLVHPIL